MNNGYKRFLPLSKRLAFPFRLIDVWTTSSSSTWYPSILSNLGEPIHWLVGVHEYIGNNVPIDLSFNTGNNPVLIQMYTEDDFIGINNITFTSKLLTKSPPNFSGLPNLLVLSLNTNNFTEPFPNLVNLPKLEVLNCIGNNSFTVGMPGPFPDLSGAPLLKSIAFKRNRLFDTSVPSLNNLGNLVNFNVESTRCRYTLQAANNLTNLAYLNCSTTYINQITSFSSSLKTTTFFLRNSNLTSAQMTAILAVLDNCLLSGASGSIDIAFNSTLDAQGIIYRSSLVSKGWTITV